MDIVQEIEQHARHLENPYVVGGVAAAFAGFLFLRSRSQNQALAVGTLPANTASDASAATTGNTSSLSSSDAQGLAAGISAGFNQLASLIAPGGTSADTTATAQQQQLLAQEVSAQSAYLQQQTAAQLAVVNAQAKISDPCGSCSGVWHCLGSCSGAAASLLGSIGGLFSGGGGIKAALPKLPTTTVPTQTRATNNYSIMQGEPAPLPGVPVTMDPLQVHSLSVPGGF